jgi:hypothetical protein
MLRDGPKFHIQELMRTDGMQLLDLWQNTNVLLRTRTRNIRRFEWDNVGVDNHRGMAFKRAGNGFQPSARMGDFNAFVRWGLSILSDGVKEHGAFTSNGVARPVRFLFLA